VSKRRSSAQNTGDHKFGGDWTTRKLSVLGKYLKAYTTALKSKRFSKEYIDAFAGSGYRTPSREPEPTESPLFPDLAAKEPQEFLDGSARIALKTTPGFDRYLFIERSPDRCKRLEALKIEFRDLSERICVIRGDANEEIIGLCRRDWRSHRAVVFLDPYGMQVRWTTVVAIAETKAMDLWLLFPLGIGVSRLLPKSGNVPESWRRRLDEFLGTTEWYDEFYRVLREPTILGTTEERVVKVSNATIGRWFRDRLRTVFPEVAEPLVLRNSTNCPLFLFCFAAGNARGAPIALRIANHLLKELR
jgi:three-Cys-motif partner protein